MSRDDIAKAMAYHKAWDSKNPDDSDLELLVENLPRADELRRISTQVLERKRQETELLQNNPQKFWEEKTKSLAPLAISALLKAVEKKAKKAAQKGESSFCIQVGGLLDVGNSRFMEKLEEYTLQEQFSTNFEDLRWVLSSAGGTTLTKYGEKAITYLRRAYTVEFLPGWIMSGKDVGVGGRSTEFAMLKISW